MMQATRANEPQAPVKIASLSDISFGYGSPQVTLFLESLAEHYGPSQAVGIEPDQVGRRLAQPKGNGTVEWRRFGSRFPPHDDVFQIEFNRQCIEFLNEFQPDVLVVQHAWVLPAALLVKKRPPFVIYYMLESLSHQLLGGDTHFLDLNRWAKDLIDLVVVAEKRRAAIDLKALDWGDKPVAELLNVSRAVSQVRHSNRTDNGRILHAGSLGEATLSMRFLDERVRHFPIDIFGTGDSAAGRALTDRLRNQDANVRYHGFVPSHELAERRLTYAYSLVMWSPDNINQLYASPNKFFESIASGVPPICTPHPQCVEIIERYKCGIVLRDWSLESLLDGLQHALTIRNTSEYRAMVKGCDEAVEKELKWSTQWGHVAEKLPARDALLAKRTK